jgi:pentatricopeptide repeat protein
LAVYDFHSYPLQAKRAFDLFENYIVGKHYKPGDRKADFLCYTPISPTSISINLMIKAHLDEKQLSKALTLFNQLQEFVDSAKPENYAKTMKASLHVALEG